jgi:sentrin-specific protease 1
VKLSAIDEFDNKTIAVRNMVVSHLVDEELNSVLPNTLCIYKGCYVTATTKGYDFDVNDLFKVESLEQSHNGLVIVTRLKDNKSLTIQRKKEKCCIKIKDGYNLKVERSQWPLKCSNIYNIHECIGQEFSAIFVSLLRFGNTDTDHKMYTFLSRLMDTLRIAIYPPVEEAMVTNSSVIKKFFEKVDVEKAGSYVEIYYDSENNDWRTKKQMEKKKRPLTFANIDSDDDNNSYTEEEVNLSQVVCAADSMVVRYIASKLPEQLKTVKDKDGNWSINKVENLDQNPEQSILKINNSNLVKSDNIWEESSSDDDDDDDDVDGSSQSKYPMISTDDLEAQSNVNTADHLIRSIEQKLLQARYNILTDDQKKQVNDALSTAKENLIALNSGQEEEMNFDADKRLGGYLYSTNIYRLRKGSSSPITLPNVKVQNHNDANLIPLTINTWLDSTIIDAYFKLLEERECNKVLTRMTRKQNYFLRETFFSNLLKDGKYDYEKVKRYFHVPPKKDINIFEYNKIFIIVNIGNFHWALVVIDMEAKTITYYDSKDNGNVSEKYLKATDNFLLDELHYWNNKDVRVDGADENFQLINAKKELYYPQQKDGFNCGIYALICADFLSDKLPLPLTFEPEEMDIMRERICLRLINKSLDYPIITNDDAYDGDDNTSNDSSMSLDINDTVNDNDSDVRQNSDREKDIDEFKFPRKRKLSECTQSKKASDDSD